MSARHDFGMMSTVVETPFVIVQLLLMCPHYIPIVLLKTCMSSTPLQVDWDLTSCSIKFSSD